MFTKDCADLLNHIRQSASNPRQSQKAADLVMHEISSFPEYVNKAVNLENVTRLSNFRYDDLERIQEAIGNADHARRRAHDTAQNACDIINKVCDRYDFGRHICPDMPTDETARHYPANRDRVADFAAGVTLETFLEGKDMSGMAGMSHEHRNLLTRAAEVLQEQGMRSYDTTAVQRRVRELADGPTTEMTTDELTRE